MAIANAATKRGRERSPLTSDKTLKDTTGLASQVSGHISSAAAGTEVAQVKLYPRGYQI